MDQMIPPGNYCIVNAAGGDLAITYHGADANLTVEVLVPGDPNQVWVVAGEPDDSQSISPLDAIILQSRPAGNFVQPLPGVYRWDLWPIGNVSEGVRVVIQDTEALRFWAIEGPAVGPDVGPGVGPGVGQSVILGEGLDILANWIFILAGP